MESPSDTETENVIVINALVPEDSPVTRALLPLRMDPLLTDRPCKRFSTFIEEDEGISAWSEFHANDECGRCLRQKAMRDAMLQNTTLDESTILQMTEKLPGIEHQWKCEANHMTYELSKLVYSQIIVQKEVIVQDGDKYPLEEPPPRRFMQMQHECPIKETVRVQGF